MENKHKKLIALGCTALAFTFLVSVPATYAAEEPSGEASIEQGEDTRSFRKVRRMRRQAKHYHNSEERQAMRAALLAGDFAAFQAIMADKSCHKDLTEEKFSQMAEVASLREAGDKEAAKALAQEYGLKKMRHKRRGHHVKKEVREALQNGDYAAWTEAIQDSKNETVKSFTEAQFNQLRDMHELRKAGDRKGAQAIADELGLERKPFKHFRRARR